MESFEKSTSEILICHKCQEAIPFGNTYYSIVKSLEFRTMSKESLEEEIEVVNAEEVTILCNVCGSYFNMKGLETILKHLPIPGFEKRN